MNLDKLSQVHAPRIVTLEESGLPYGNEYESYLRGERTTGWEQENPILTKLLESLHPLKAEHRSEIEEKIASEELDLNSLYGIPEERILMHREVVQKLLRATNQEGIEEQLAWMDVGDFYIAPGSSKPDRHGCFLGGLVLHELNVLYELVLLDQINNSGLSYAEMVDGPLMHDMCKIGFYYFDPNRKVTKSNKKENKGEIIKVDYEVGAKPYRIVETFQYGHGEKSELIAREFVKLNKKERMMIRWHMGQYDGEWVNKRDWVQDVCPQAILFQSADHLSARFLDQNVNFDPVHSLQTLGFFEQYGIDITSGECYQNYYSEKKMLNK